MSKRIGFVDYELDNFHANVYLKHLRNELSDRGYTVAGCFGLNAESGQEWAAKNDVTWFDSVAAMNEHVDFFMVLAPSNPELHLELCEQTFPHGKATYVDKTFAQDVATAEAIFALADRYNVPMDTTSALRYTGVQEYAKASSEPVQHMISWGPGKTFGEYGIHPLELVISCMGGEVTRLSRRGNEPNIQLILDFTEGRTAIVNVYTDASTPYAASVTTASKTEIMTIDLSQLFLDAAKGILALFEGGQPTIDRAESLMIRRILDLALTPEAESGIAL